MQSPASSNDSESQRIVGETAEGERSEKAALILWSLGAWYKKKKYEEGGLSGSRRKLRRMRTKLREDGKQETTDLYGYDSPSYGSIILQLREASSDSDGACLEFLSKGLEIVANTIVVTVLLGLLLFLPLGMITIGLKNLSNCPVEPKIPIYLLVGGCFGFLKLITLLFYQVRSRRYDKLDNTSGSAGNLMDAMDDMDESGGLVALSSSRFMDVLLSGFLFAWFVCGNVWVFRIWQPLYHQTLDEPNAWCDKTAYLLAMVQICISYVLMGVITLLTIFLTLCQICWSSNKHLPT